MNSRSNLCRRLSLGLALLGIGCTRSPYRWSGGTVDVTHVEASRVTEPLTPARWVIVPRDDERDFVDVDADGQRRIITMGLRIVQRAGRSPERAREILPPADSTVALRVPDRLGGGFLFYTVEDGSTSVWRTTTWTGQLSPMTTLPFEISRFVAGFDRFYVQRRPSSEIVGIDAQDGALSDLGPLPLTSAYGAMAFGDAWLGAVEADIRGPLVTFDAGASWLPIDVTTTLPGIGEERGEVILNTTRGRFAIEPTGVLRQLTTPTGERTFDPIDVALGEATDEQPEAAEPSPRNALPSLLGPSALIRAVLSGARDQPTTAVVAQNGVLARVDLRDGRIIEARRNSYAVGDHCDAVRLGRKIAFVCGEERGRTVIYEFVPPLSMRPQLIFESPRYVASSGNGRLVVRGRCKDEAEPSAGLKTYCIVSEDRRTEIRVRGDIGAERVVALSDGRVVVIIPPRLGALGALSRIDPAGHTTTRALSLKGLAKQGRQLVESGLWLDGWVEYPKGSLSGWVAGDGSFAGVRVTLDGQVAIGSIAADIESTLFSGRFALRMGSSDGVVRETLDGGASWSVAHLPERLSDRAGVLPQQGHGGDMERGCSPIGCAFGSWVRVGWGRSAAAETHLRVAAPPAKARRSDRGFTSWNLRCTPTGVSSQGARIVIKRASEPAADIGSARWSGSPPAGLQSSSWRPFLGVPPPTRRVGELGFDFGTEDDMVQVRGYAWGPQSPVWGRLGRWTVRAVDRFSVQDAIWSTAHSNVPWQDALIVAQTFGSDPSHQTSTTWSALLDPGGTGGLLVIRARGEAELAIIERDHGIVLLNDPGGWASERLTGAVKVGSTWYAGAASSPRLFRVAKIEGTRIDVLGNYPRYTEGLPPQIVRATSGEAIGIWAIGQDPLGSLGGGHWYVYPLDPQTGAAQTPIAVPFSDLQSVPRPCNPDDEGWLVVHPVSPSVASIDLIDGAEGISANKLEARLVVDRDGVCVAALAAQVDQAPITDRLSRGRSLAETATTPMTLTDRVSDTRWEFRCGS